MNFWLQQICLVSWHHSHDWTSFSGGFSYEVCKFGHKDCVTVYASFWSLESLFNVFIKILYSFNFFSLSQSLFLYWCIFRHGDFVALFDECVGLASVDLIWFALNHCFIPTPCPLGHRERDREKDTKQRWILSKYRLRGHSLATEVWHRQTWHPEEKWLCAYCDTGDVKTEADVPFHYYKLKNKLIPHSAKLSIL